MYRLDLTTIYSSWHTASKAGANLLVQIGHSRKPHFLRTFHRFRPHWSERTRIWATADPPLSDSRALEPN